jgi:hypothetical protein
VVPNFPSLHARRFNLLLILSIAKLVQESGNIQERQCGDVDTASRRKEVEGQQNEQRTSKDGGIGREQCNQKGKSSIRTQGICTAQDVQKAFAELWKFEDSGIFK